MSENKIRLPRLLNINQVAKILGAVPITPRGWDKSGKLRAVIIGNYGAEKNKEIVKNAGFEVLRV